MTPLKLPIGYDDFREIIENKFYLVDKSLLIKDILDDSSKIILITRPRRFGKTLNLSMLRYYLASEVHGETTEGLFEGLSIKNESEQYLAHQGKYPVIFISFKDVKDHSYEVAYQRLQALMSKTYSEFRYLLSSDKLYEEDKKYISGILAQEINEQANFDTSLENLTRYLYQHHGVKPWLLMDEYDTPIQAGYLNNYYEKIISLFQGLFGAALKTNSYLYKAVLTGILRISKESLFSGLNNVDVFSMLRSEYGIYFGFTENEVRVLLEKTNLTEIQNEIQKWYNGYKCGEVVLYNPWSIVNCIKREGLQQPYWINTSDNALVKTLLIKSTLEFKEQLELLLDDKPLEKTIDDSFVYGDLDLPKNISAVWSLLLMTGYLKVVSVTQKLTGAVCQLKIPNEEIRSLYQTIIEQWLSNGYGIDFYNKFLSDLLEGHIEGVYAGLESIMSQTASVYDLAKEPEAFYHGLLLGLIASVDRTRYELKSNREAGFGRYDIAIIPKVPTVPGIIIELKRYERLTGSDKEIDDMLIERAKEALLQIERRDYVSEFKNRNLHRIIKIGLSFFGKKFKILSEEASFANN